ncbi:hypothetical protein AMTRI_Chr06g198300 [Amborella trichopoda]
MRGGGEKHSTTYKSFTLHRPKRWHVLTGKGMCFIIAKQDGAVLLGLHHPWEGHEDHANGHEHEHEVKLNSS